MSQFWKKITTGQSEAVTRHQDVQSKDRREEFSWDLVIISYIHYSAGPSAKFSAAESCAFLSLPAVRDNPFEQVSSRKKPVR